MSFKIQISVFHSKRNLLKNIYIFLEIVHKKNLENISLTKITQFLFPKPDIVFKKQIHK